MRTLALLVLLVAACGGSELTLQRSDVELHRSDLVLQPPPTHAQNNPGMLCARNPSGLPGDHAPCLINTPPGTRWGFASGFHAPPTLGPGETAIYSSSTLGYSPVWGPTLGRGNCVILSAGTTLDYYWLELNGWLADWTGYQTPVDPPGQLYPHIGIVQILVGPHTASCVGNVDVSQPGDAWDCMGNSSDSVVPRTETVPSGQHWLVGSISSVPY
jgi:hypothetical protein